MLPSAATTASNLFARRAQTNIAQVWRSSDPRAPLTWVIPTARCSSDALLRPVHRVAVSRRSRRPLRSSQLSADDWPTRSVADTRAAQIKTLEDYAFTLTGADDDRLGLRTDSLLIIKGGELIYERYARGYDATNRHLSWSVAKSFSSALTGVAVQLGALRLDTSICPVHPRAARRRLPNHGAKPDRVLIGLRLAGGLRERELPGVERDRDAVREGHRDMLNFITGTASSASRARSGATRRAKRRCWRRSRSRCCSGGSAPTGRGPGCSTCWG